MTASAPDVRGVVLNPLEWPGGALWHVATTLTDTASRSVAGALQIAGGLLNPAAESSLTGPVTTMRRFSAAHVRLRDVERIQSRFDVTLNDVALAAITSSYRDA